MSIQDSVEGWKRRVLGYALWISVGILLGRLAGFVRESSLAARFGTTSEADVAVILLTVPDMLVNMLVGGALAVALIPEFKRFGAGHRGQALFVQASVAIGLVFVLLVAVLSVFSSTLLDLVAPGLALVQRESATNLLSQVLWVIPLTTLAGVTTAYLQANERFVVPALGTLIYNSVLVVVILLLLDQQKPLDILILGILGAAALRWVSQLMRIPWKPIVLRSMRWRLLHRALLVRYVQALGAGSLIILLPVIARALASEQGEGTMALFNYAHKLVEFPLGVGVSVLAVAIFPMLSQAFSRGDDVSRTIGSSLRIVIVLSLSMSISLYVYRELFAQLTFGWGNMTADAVMQLTKLFSIGLLGLPLQGISSLLLAVFNARRDTITPLRINIIAVIVFLPGGLFVAQKFGLSGIMASLVGTYALICVAQVVMLRKRHAIAVVSLLNPIKLAGLLVSVTVLSLLAISIRDALEPGFIIPVFAAFATGVMMLVTGLLVMGEGRMMTQVFLHKGRR